MSTARDVSSRLRQRIWNGSIPLEIRLDKGDCRTYDSSDPYLIQFPRLSYLGLLLLKLHAFFSNDRIYPDVDPSETWLSYEGVPLKWHYPLGLLYDLYAGAEPISGQEEHVPGKGVTEDEESAKKLPWKLTVHFSKYPTDQLVKLDAQEKHLHDLFINSVKEADFLRNGNGRTVMSLSEKDSTQLWDSVKEHNFQLFNPINQKLLNPQGVNLRFIPIKLYLPHAASSDSKDKETTPGSLRVVQGLVAPNQTSRTPQTVGTALNQVAKSVFPNRTVCLIAQPVLHGAVLPMKAPVEELMRATAYLDGWLHISVVLLA